MHRLKEKAHRGAVMFVVLLWLFPFAGCGSMAQKEARFAAKLEPYEEAVDEGCAGFHFLWGKTAELEGRFEEARFAYEQALVCDRKATYVRKSLAALLMRMNMKGEAIAVLKQALVDAPEDSESRILLGKLLVTTGKRDEALALYQEMLAQEPANESVALLVASIYGSERQPEKAREVLERFLAQDPGSYAGYYYLARVYRELGRNRKAYDSYLKALDITWSVSLAFEAASFCDSLSWFEESESLYRRILSEDPENEQARMLLINSLIGQERIDDAVEELKTLREVSRNPNKIDLALARLLIEAERYGEALEVLDRLVERDPSLPRARLFLILSLYRQGGLGQAEDALDSLDPASEAFEDAVLLLAGLLEEDEKPAQAESFLKRILARPNGSRPPFIAALARLYRLQGRAQEGERLFEEARGKAPQDPKLLLEYGLYLDRIGKRDQALRLMQEVLKLSPHDPLALNYVGYTWADQGINLEQAKAYIEEAVSLRPKDGFIRDSLGWVYFRLGDFERAAKELEKAVELTPDDPTIHEHLGDVYRALARFLDARIAYEQALKHCEDEAQRAAIQRKLSGLPLE